MKIEFEPDELFKKGATLKQIMDAIEKRILIHLEVNLKNTRTAMSEICGISRQALQKKLAKHHIKNIKGL